MNVSSSLPDFLTSDQSSDISGLFGNATILPISCLLWQSDVRVLIHKERRISDDLIYAPRDNVLTCRVEDETRIIAPGEFMMVAAGNRHSAFVADNGPSQTFALHMHLVDADGHRFLSRLSSPFGVFSDRESWFDRLSICAHLMGLGKGTGDELFRSLIRLLLAEQISKGCTLHDLPQKMDLRISNLLSEVRQFCDRDWSVTAMANYCNMSVTGFRRLFRKSTGESPKKFVQKVRLTHARSILATRPDLSVEEVANQVGIPDAHYFHAIYKDMFGETPKGKRKTDEH